MNRVLIISLIFGILLGLSAGFLMGFATQEARVNKFLNQTKEALDQTDRCIKLIKSFKNYKM